MAKTIRCTYEQVILLKRIPYWIYWSAIGILGFTMWEIVIRAFGDKHFLWTQLLFGGGIALLPMTYVWMSHNFQNIMRILSPLLWSDNAEFEGWLEVRATRVFTLNSWQARLVTGFIVISALITVILSRLPFNSSVLNFLALIGFTPLLVVCGQGAYILTHLLVTLREIVRRPPKVPFFMLSHSAISGLQNYYSATAVVVTLAYICLVIAVWQGPYGLSLEMQIWLTVLAFYPLSMFFWSFFQVHILMRNIKQSHIEIINQEVQLTLEKVLSRNENEDVERLDKVMDIQNRIQTTKEWPVDLQGTLTFLIALTTAIVQVMISIVGILKP